MLGGEKLLEESTDLRRSIHEMDLINPVPRHALCIGVRHPLVVGRVNVVFDLITLNPFMRKVPDKVAAMWPSIFPAVALRQIGRICEKLRAR